MLPVFPFDKLDNMADTIEKLHTATATFTGDPIAEQLLDCINWPNTHDGNLVDPSCGDGDFLIRALERLLHTIDAHDNESLLRIEGWEINPQTCTQTRQRVATRLIVAGRSANDATLLAKLMVKNRDFLTDSPNLPTWDAIAGKPNWVSQKGATMLPDQRARFIDRCAQAIRHNGIIAFVSTDSHLNWCMEVYAHGGNGKLETVRSTQIGENISL